MVVIFLFFDEVVILQDAVSSFSVEFLLPLGEG
jgi:hypothetical protein